MDIVSNPDSLNITSDEVSLCPKCNSNLFKKIEKKWRQIGNDCGWCRYSDRPFTLGSSSLESHYPNGCTCKYEETGYILLITCHNCLHPPKISFSEKWKNSSAIDKLKLYGIRKLKLLAKSKKIKGYSKYKKKELIDVLQPLINDNDFPIK